MTELDGRPQLCFGSDISEDAARMKGLELLGGDDFKIVKLHHRDLGSASAELRGKRLEQTHSLRKATMRIGHEKSLKKIRRRLSRETQTGPQW